MEAGREGLVAGDDFEAVGDFWGGWLFGGWLELVARGKAGEENVDGEVEEGCGPEKYHLDEECAAEFDGGGRVGLHHLGPCFFHFRGVDVW